MSDHRICTICTLGLRSTDEHKRVRVRPEHDTPEIKAALKVPDATKPLKPGLYTQVCPACVDVLTPLIAQHLPIEWANGQGNAPTKYGPKPLEALTDGDLQ